jgi:pimeloyl-ACP methyl ester carboxylesterase
MDEEWKHYQKTEATSKHQNQSALEYAQYPPSFSVLAKKQQLGIALLGDRPVCVIKGDNQKDFEKLYKAGIALGNGNETERSVYLDILKTWDVKDRALQLGNMSLSRNSRYFEVPGSGHNVHLTNPSAIAEGVKWTLAEIRKGSLWV